MQKIQKSVDTTSLADILERVLDKGIVIAGDICISIAQVELLTIKIRLVICSVDKAQEIGINWWRYDSALNGSAQNVNNELSSLREENLRLKQQLIQNKV